MAEANSTRAISPLTLDLRDEICQRLHKALGIVDLLGNANE